MLGFAMSPVGSLLKAGAKKAKNTGAINEMADEYGLTQDSVRMSMGLPNRTGLFGGESSAQHGPGFYEGGDNAGTPPIATIDTANDPNNPNNPNNPDADPEITKDDLLRALVATWNREPVDYTPQDFYLPRVRLGNPDKSDPYRTI